MHLGIGRIVVVAATLVLAPLAPTYAQAARKIQTYKSWILYDHDSDNGKVCFITTTATKQEGVKVQRDPPRIFVTRFPVPSPNEQVMIDPGYRFKPNANITLGIDTKVFSLLAKDDKAWSKTATDDTAIVAAMRKGTEAVVKGVSSIDTNPVDTYSLAGFAAAYDALGQACKNAGRR